MTNAEFAKSDKLFKKACEIAGLGMNGNTRRQASKWHMHKGRAWAARWDAEKALAQEACNA